MTSKLVNLALGLVLVVFAPSTFAAEGQPLASPEVTAAMQPYLDSYKLAGVIAIIADRSGKVHYRNLLGYADVEAKKPISEDNVFWIASMSKMFAGASIMMLVDEGKVSLDDPVTKFIPQLNKWMVRCGKGPVACPAETSGSPGDDPACAQPHQRTGRHFRASASHGGGQHAAEGPRAQLRHRSAPMAAGRQVRLWQSGDEHRRAHRRDRQRHAL